jgi:hypothetical protein
MSAFTSNGTQGGIMGSPGYNDENTNSLPQEAASIRTALTAGDLASINKDGRITKDDFKKIYNALKYFIIIGGTYEMIASAAGGHQVVLTTTFKTLFMIVSALVSTTMKVSYAAAITACGLGGTCIETIVSTISGCVSGGLGAVNTIAGLLVGMTTYLTYENITTVLDFAANRVIAQVESEIDETAQRIGQDLLEKDRFELLMQSGADIVNYLIVRKDQFAEGVINTLVSENVWQLLAATQVPDINNIKLQCVPPDFYIRGVTDGARASAVTCSLVQDSIAGPDGWNIYLTTMRRKFGFSLSDCMSTAAGRFLFANRNAKQTTVTLSQPESYLEKPDLKRSATLPTKLDASQAESDAIAQSLYNEFKRRELTRPHIVSSRALPGLALTESTAAAEFGDDESEPLVNNPSTYERNRAYDIFAEEGEALQASAYITACENAREGDEVCLRNKLGEAAKRKKPNGGSTRRHKKRRAVNRKTKKGRKTKTHRKKRGYRKSRR